MQQGARRGAADLAILGPGVLGLSLAQWAAECGLVVRLLGRDLDHAARGCMEIERRWAHAVAKGRMRAEARAEAQARLSPQGFGPDALQALGTLLEAIPEDPDRKADVLAAAGAWAPADLVILTGTSSLPVSTLAERAGLQGRLLGFHLFVPVPRMPVVELVVPGEVADGLIQLAAGLAERLGKRAVRVRDQPGFAAARMALAQGLEAMRLLESGAASADDLDALMTLGYGHPVGPLELSDRVGLDLRLRIADSLHAATGEPRFLPPALLRDKVARGETGLRAGRGFYDWDASGRRK
jgi:3-hydroxybutyryl-CoA dehydrogenase